MADTLTAQELKMLMGASGVTLLDVRRKGDRESGSSGIHGAVWKDPEHVDEWSSELLKDKPVVMLRLPIKKVTSRIFNGFRGERGRFVYRN
ncbi:MAG: sulfurtransferase [Deltaproteobacteria bacterium HGW-Deltaproteobacteria-18]|nr:MAG: sulfurtransferase [Deltaproteobacteria bacterium HGW-Deltaproteobacteria-18]